MICRFKTVKLEHILRNSNSRADTLSKLASQKGRGRYDLVIQLTLSQPSVSIGECINVEIKEAEEIRDIAQDDKKTVMTIETQPH